MFALFRKFLFNRFLDSSILLSMSSDVDIKWQFKTWAIVMSDQCVISSNGITKWYIFIWKQEVIKINVLFVKYFHVNERIIDQGLSPWPSTCLGVLTSDHWSWLWKGEAVGKNRLIYLTIQIHSMKQMLGEWELRAFYLIIICYMSTDYLAQKQVLSPL